MKQLQPTEIQDRIASGEAFTLLDVREQEEWDHCRLPGAILRPLSRISDWEVELASQPGELIVYCHHGIRSARVCARLRALGHAGPINLAGGIDRWSETVDPELPRY